MKTFAVARKADGAVIYRYQATEPIPWNGMEFDTHTHAEEAVAPPAAAPTAPTLPRRVTRLAFRQRFTAAEKAAIELAALDVPAAPMAQRAMAAGLRASLADQAAATFIDLDRSDTRAGVQQLEALGLLAAGRAIQVLDAPVTPTEAWAD